MKVFWKTVKNYKDHYEYQGYLDYNFMKKIKGDVIVLRANITFFELSDFLKPGNEYIEVELEEKRFYIQRLIEGWYWSERCVVVKDIDDIEKYFSLILK